MLRSLLALGVFALALAALVWSLRGFETDIKTATVSALNEPRYIVKNAEWTHLNAKGVAEFHLTADTVDYYDDRSAMLSNVVMDRLNSAQSPWRLNAPRGMIPARENRVLLQKPVNATGTMQSGETVQFITDHLWADNTRNELYTDDAVQMRSANWQANGKGLRADLAGAKVNLLHNVKVNYVPQH